MVMMYMNIIKNLIKNKSIKSMKETLNSLFVDSNASKDDDDLDDFDFDGTKIKPFNDCFFMHNQEFQHEDYNNEYDESLDLFIPSGDDI